MIHLPYRKLDKGLSTFPPKQIVLQASQLRITLHMKWRTLGIVGVVLDHNFLGS